MAFGASSGSRQNNADGKIVIGTSVDMYGMNTGLKKIGQSWKKLQYLTGGALGVIGLVKFGKAALDAASDLQEVQNIVDVAFGDMVGKIESFSQTCIKDFGISELAAKQTAGSFMAMGKSMGLSMEQASDMAISLTGLTADMASFYNISQDYARVALSAVYTGETETLKRYGIVLTEANLQQYASTLGIQTKVKAMDSASKAMLRYQYILQATGDIQGDFARTSGSWANQVRLLKEQWTVFLNVVGSGLITVLTPLLRMLNSLIAAVTAFARVIGAALVNIFGLEVQKVGSALGAVGDAAGGAAEGIGGVGDAAGDAGKKAKKAHKEMNKLLADYDELKVIKQETPDTGSGSGGSGGGGGGGGLMDMSIPTAGNGLLDDIKDIFSDIDNMFDLGRMISDKIAESLENIPWNKIKKKFNSFCKKIAQFLNGLITPRLFAAVGATLAEALNTIIGGALTFSEEFDWENLGNSLAAGVNKFFTTFDFAQLANAIDSWVQGLYTAISTFIAKVDWSKVLKGIWDFLTNLDLKTVEIIISAIVLKKVGKWIFGGGAIKLLKKVLVPILTKAVGMALSDFALTGSLKSAVSVFWGTVFGTGAEGLAATIMTTITGILGVLGGAVIAVKNFFDMWKNGWDLLSTIFEAIGIALMAIGAIILGAPALVAGIVAAVVFAVSQIAILLHDNWDAVKAWASGVAEWWDKHVITPIVTFFKNMWKKITGFFKSAVTNIKKIWGKVTDWFKKNITEPIAKFFDDTWKNIKNTWEGVSKWFDTHVAKPVAAIFEWVGQVMETVWIIIKAIWIIISTWFNNKVVKPIKKFWEGLMKTLQEKVESAKKKINNTFQNIANFFNTKVVGPVKKWWQGVTDDLKKKINAAKKVIVGVWGVIASVFNTKVVTPIKTKWEGLMKSLKSKIDGFKKHVTSITTKIKGNWSVMVGALKSGWSGFTSGVKSQFSTAVNWVRSKAQSFVNSIIDGINSFTSGLSVIGKAASKITGDDYSGIGQIKHVSFPPLAKGAVIPPNKEFLALLGDQKQGTNIETPLDTMVEAFERALDSRGSSGNSQPIVLQLNGKQIAQAVWDEREKRYKQTGNTRYAY